MSWPELTDWWITEVASDPAYQEVVTPLLFEVFNPVEGHRYLDLGGGEGRVAREVERRGGDVTLLDGNVALASMSGVLAVVAELPGVPLRADTFDGAYCVLTLEHITDHRLFLDECARVVKPGGVLAVVANHPTWTAPHSTPITDAYGEVLWRPGDYFSSGSSEVPAGEQSVVFHHRSLSNLLQAAADARWSLERIVEVPHHEIEDQSGIPRLLACRWRLI